MHDDQQATAYQFADPSIPDDLSLKLREQEELLRTIAHDLRNPLGGIKSLTELLLEEQAENSGQYETLTAIRQAASHSLKLVEGLLLPLYQPLRSHTVSVSSLHQALKNCVRLVQHTLDEKRQQLDLHLHEGSDELVIGQERLTRVIDNLISNAIKFTPDSGRIVITTQAMSSGIQLMVKDNGLGIADTVRAKIFEGSEETRRAGTRGEVSHGLGLPICKKIIEQSGGTITFQSKPGKGTIFYVWLPVPQQDVEL